jgi:hypothetical protein
MNIIKFLSKFNVYDKFKFDRNFRPRLYFHPPCQNSLTLRKLIGRHARHGPLWWIEWERTIILMPRPSAQASTIDLIEILLCCLVHTGLDCHHFLLAISFTRSGAPLTSTWFEIPSYSWLAEVVVRKRSQSRTRRLRVSMANKPSPLSSFYQNPPYIFPVAAVLHSHRRPRAHPPRRQVYPLQVTCFSSY